MANYTSAYTGAEIDAAIAKVAGSNLATTFKITRPSALVIAASNSTAVDKAQADYVCDGTADDVEIAAALTAAASGSTIIFLEGTYTLAAAIVSTGKNITLLGRGDVVINDPVTTADQIAFKFTGSLVSSPTLTADAAAGADYVTFSSVSGVAVGQLVLLYTGDIWSPTIPAVQNGELYKIRKIDGSNVYFEEPLFRAYPSATSGMHVYSPVTVHIENIKLIGPAEDSSRHGWRFDFADGCTMRRCHVSGFGTSNIKLCTCYDFELSDSISTFAKRAGYGYGILIINATARVRIENNTMTRCRHCVASGAESNTHGQVRDVIINGNILSAETVVDSHACARNYTVTNNLMVGYADGFSDGTLSSVFANNIVYLVEIPGSGVAAGGAVIDRDSLNYPRNRTIANNVVVGGRLYQNTEYTVLGKVVIDGNNVTGGSNTDNAVYMKPQGVAVESILIANNNFATPGSKGIYLLMTSAPSTAVINIHGNTITNSVKEGIYVALETAHQHLVAIQSNVILNPNTSGPATTYPAIICDGVVNGVISNNVINDMNGHAGAGIRTGTGCDYNFVFGNTVKGVTGTKISLTGSNNTSEHNVEFA